MSSINAKTAPLLKYSSMRVRAMLSSLLAWPLIGFAQAAPFAAPEQVAPAHAGVGALRVVVALLIVIGAVIVAGRIARRLRGFGGGGTAGLEVIGQLPVGPRERAVLIRVGEHQLLLGVAPGQVRTLHVLEDLTPARAGADASTTSAAATPVDRPTFKSILLKSLGK